MSAFQKNRKISGFCCNRYYPCGITGSYEFNDDGTILTSQTDALCNTLDFLGIEGSSSSCNRFPGSLSNRYCGAAFSASDTATEHETVCGELCLDSDDCCEGRVNSKLALPTRTDCTAPFKVGVFTDTAVLNPDQMGERKSLSFKHVNVHKCTS